MPLEGPKTVWAGLGSCWGIIGPLQGQGTGWKRLVWYADSGLVWACSLIVFYSVWFGLFVCCNTLGATPAGWAGAGFGALPFGPRFDPFPAFCLSGGCRVGLGENRGFYGVLVDRCFAGAGNGFGCWCWEWLRNGSGMAQEWLRIRNQPTGWKGAGSVN